MVYCIEFPTKDLKYCLAFANIYIGSGSLKKLYIKIATEKINDVRSNTTIITHQVQK